MDSQQIQELMPPELMEFANPITGEVVPVNDVDGLISAYEEVSEMDSKLWAFKKYLAEAIASHAPDIGTKTRRVRGETRRAKVEIPDDGYDQTILKEAWNAFPELREDVLGIASISIRKRELNKILNESGPPDFEQFKRMLIAANKGPCGTPRIKIET